MVVLNDFCIVKWNIPHENPVKAIFLEVLVPVVDAGLVMHLFSDPVDSFKQLFHLTTGKLPMKNYYINSIFLEVFAPE